jgi:hypothetical protein
MGEASWRVQMLLQVLQIFRMHRGLFSPLMVLNQGLLKKHLNVHVHTMNLAGGLAFGGAISSAISGFFD